MELLNAFQSMEHSNEQLTDILEIAKQTSDANLKDTEIREIEDLLRKLQDTFANTSATELLKLSSVRGEFQEQKEKITQIGAQFQSMEALMANMAQTLLGLDSIRNRFGEVYGDYTGLLADLQKSQQTSNGAKLNLMRFSLEQTKETIEQSTAEFKRQMLDVMSLYEALGAQYYQMMESDKIDEYENIQTPPPEPTDDHGDEAENADQQNAENAEAQAEEIQADAELADAVADAESEPEVAAEQAEQDAVAEILAVTDEQIVQELTEQYGNDMPTDIINAIDDLEEEQQQQMLLRGGAIGGAASAGGEQQAAGGGGAGAASAGGEQQAAGGGGSGGAAAAPAGAEQQQAAGGGGAAHAAAAPVGAEQQQAAGGGGAAHAAAAPAGAEQQQAAGGGGAAHAAAAPAGAEQQQAMGAHSAQQQNAEHHAATITAETDRGRSDEREKTKSRKPRSRKAKS